MNKRQQKKSVMRNVSKLYDMAFERERFRRDVAIICGRGLRNPRVLTTMVVKRAVYEYAPFEEQKLQIFRTNTRITSTAGQ